MKAFGQSNRGFTLIEVIVVIFIISVIASLLLSAIGSAKSKSRTLICKTNKRQLTQTWALYSMDNKENLALNTETTDGQNDPPPEEHSWPDPWVRGLVRFDINQSITNIAYVSHKGYASFATYINRYAINVYKCTEDNYLSKEQKKLGYVKRIRNATMNYYLGNDVHAKSIKEKRHGDCIIYQNQHSIRNPSSTFVFSDTHPGDIRGVTQGVGRGKNCFGPNRNIWDKLPGALHEGGSTISFADGHVILRKWKGGLLKQPVNPEASNNGGNQILAREAENNKDVDDIKWMQKVSTQKKL